MVEREFKEVIYNNEGIIRPVKISEMTEQNYRARFKSHIYCPTEGCEARMKFVPLSSGNKYFAAIDSETHIDICPHKKKESNIEQFPNTSKVVSDHHIKSSLRYYMRKYLLKEENPLHDSTSTNKPKRIRSCEEDSLGYVPCEDIDSSMTGDIVCIGGIIADVQSICDGISNRFAFFNFDLKNSKLGVSVKISPSLYREDEETAEFVNRIKRKSDGINISNDKLLLCICYGKIRSCDKGFNIIPTKLLSIHFATRQKKG